MPFYHHCDSFNCQLDPLENHLKRGLVKESLGKVGLWGCVLAGGGAILFKLVDVETLILLVDSTIPEQDILSHSVNTGERETTMHTSILSHSDER